MEPFGADAYASRRSSRCANSTAPQLEEQERKRLYGAGWSGADRPRDVLNGRHSAPSHVVQRTVGAFGRELKFGGERWGPLGRRRSMAYELVCYFSILHSPAPTIPVETAHVFVQTSRLIACTAYVSPHARLNVGDSSSC